MKTVSLALVAVTALTLAACGGRNEDQLNETEINVDSADQLNAQADEAANVAAEAQQLENQAADLEREVQQAENATGAQTDYDENIQGM